jgi:hypothetical protein
MQIYFRKDGWLVMKKPVLTDEDKERVKVYLSNNPLHSTKRKPFAFWRLFAVLFSVVSLLALLSFFVAKIYFFE